MIIYSCPQFRLTQSSMKDLERVNELENCLPGTTWGETTQVGSMAMGRGHGDTRRLIWALYGHNKVVWGYIGFNPSVRPSDRPASCVRSVAPTVLVGSISYLYILSSNFRRCVACNVFAKFQNSGSASQSQTHKKLGTFRWLIARLQ